jgi:murein peptide amidase A
MDTRLVPVLWSGWMQRLFRNKTCYAGETIDIDCVLREMDELALASNWNRELFLEGDPCLLRAFHRQSSGAKRIYISTGIHGDEPAGPLAVLELMRRNAWGRGVDLWICPCLNPTGFPLNQRENARGLDLNRQYHAPEAPEIRAHVQWLQRHPTFDLALCLHEDWEAHGFYLYELNPDGLPSCAEQIIQQVSRVCPIDPSSEIEGRPAHGGIVRPSTDPQSRLQWPEAFYLLRHKTRQSYTLEAPSDFPLETRVNALVCAVETVLEAAARPQPPPARREPPRSFSSG